LVELIKNIFITLFVKRNLIHCGLFYELFDKIKNYPPQVSTLFRQEYVRYTYFPLCYENINQLKFILKKYADNSIYEIAAGSGWLSYYLNRYGVRLINVIDDYSWDKLFEKELPLPVERIDAIKAIERDNPAAVLINYPPPDEDFLERCFGKMKKNSFFIVVCDRDHNVAGNRNFFISFSDKIIFEQELFYSFPGFNDTIFVYKK